MAEDKTWPVPKSWYGVTTRQRDFGRSVLDMAAIYSSPVILTRSSDHSVYQNASGFLLKLGDRTFLVTNAHVLDDGYLPMKFKYEDAVFIFADRAFVPRVIDKNSDENIDLAVIDVTGIEFEKSALGYWGSAAALLSTYAPPIWPLPGPQPGESTVIVGWPGHYRERQSDGSMEFAAFPMLGNAVDAVTELWFSVALDRDQMISSSFDPGNPVVAEKDFGGMSGCPVFALRNGVNPLQLIGVVRTYGTGFDLLYCTRVDLIRTDGSICVPNSA